MSHMNKRFVHLVVAVPSEASETMVELCFWPSTVLTHKLAIYCDIICYILCTMDLYVLRLQKREKQITHCNPLQKS
jgi:hypothetical protein